MKIPSSSAVVAFAALLSSCSASRQGIPPIPLQDKLAVVAFHFDGFSDPEAAATRSRPRERGPGASPRRDALSLADEQVALDSVWARFQAGLPAALGASVASMEEVASNPAYAQLPTAQVRPGGSEPSGFKAVDVTDEAGLRALSAGLGARRLLLVESWADYDTATSGAADKADPVAPSSLPQAKDSTRIVKDSAKSPAGNAAKAAPAVATKSVKVALHVALRLYEAGKGVYWTGRYLAVTGAFAQLQGGRVPSSFLVGHLAEAVNPILVRISQDAALGRGRGD
jgi:hypothetical protein